MALIGWKAKESGDKAGAELALRKAADLQDRLASNYVIIKPVREMMGDVLFQNGEPAKALTEYKAVLELQPNRLRSVFGAGSAALAVGDK